MKANLAHQIPRVALTLLMMLALSLTASATVFITDVMVIGNNDQTAFYNLQSSYEAQGWIAINKDLNAGCGSGSDYIHLLYKTSLCTGSSSTSITDFYIRTGNNPPATLTHQGRTYHLVPFDGSTNFINSQGDLNRGAGGDYIHLYYTKEALPNQTAVTAINFNATQSGAVGSNGGTTGYDLNSGCGAGTNYIYMHLTTTSTAGSYAPQYHLDACTGGTANIYLSGWTFDRDASSEPLVVHVYIYTDSGYSNLYMPVQVVQANVPRPDVNSAYNITGNHGFKTNILIGDAGNYWIKLYAVDYNGGTNSLIGSRSVTVTAGNIVTLTSESGNVQLHQGDVLTGTGGPDTHVTIADGATVTLVGVNITDIANNSSHCWSGLTCLGDAVIVLEVGSTNDVKGGYVSSGIRVPVGKTLTIQGNGTLNATGVGGGAGIGSALDTSSSCGNITISGGTVNATGANGGAGIGSGITTSCGNITINGGTVNATGGEDAAGIGSGYYYSSCGNITITNGVTRVTATKSSGANNAIGAGTNSSCGTVTIGSVQTGFITQSPFITYPYTVSFNSNSGTGTMANTSFMYNVAQQLPANSFTFTDHNFIGWATSANGPKMYDDEQIVSNLTSTAGATVTLYAKWRLICYQPTALAAEVDAHSAMLSWEGTSESYTVRHREPEHFEIDFFEAFNTNNLPTGWMKYAGLVDDVVNGNATLTASTTTFSWNPNTYALGTYNMKINIWGSNTYHWLVTPDIVIHNGNMTFDLALTAYNSTNAASGTCDDDRFVVLVYANNAWNVLREWNNSNSNYVFNEIATAGEQVSIDLSAYIGQTVKMAFYAESTVGGNGDNDLHIDNIAIGHHIITSATEWESVTVDETTVTLTDLDAETTYEVMVQGICGDDNYSEWSDILTFTTDTACFVPTNLTCTGVTATTATLTWESEASAWQIMLNNDASNLIDADENPFTLTGLITNNIYTAKVKAVCGGNDESGWSDAISFEPTDKVIIGSGDDGLNCLPFNNYYKYSLTQQIYTIAELGEAGLIESIDFYKNSAVECNRNLNIYMVHTDKNNFDSDSDWIPVTEADLVFSGTVSFSDNAWTTILLDNSFIYDGLHNVAIVVDDNTGSYKSSTDFRTFFTTDEQFQSIYQESDNTNFDPINPPAFAKGRKISKNQIRVGKSAQGDCMKPMHLTATEIGPNFAVLDWEEYGTSESWLVTYNDATVEASEHPFTLTGLAPETEYTIAVSPACNASLSSLPITITTLVDCPAPSNVEVSDITFNSANVTWSGYNESYTVHYRPLEAPFLREGFEGGVMPTGWTVEGDTQDTTKTWRVGVGDQSTSTGTHSGNYNALIIHKIDDNVTYLITPAMDLSGQSNLTLSFWYINRKWVSDIDGFGVCYRQGENGEWNELWSTTENHETWTNQLVNLTGLCANYQIGFRMTDNYGYGVGLDDILIGTEQNNEWVAITEAVTPQALTDLISGTEYEVYVTPTCDPTAMSETITFTTTEVPVVEQTIALSAGTNWFSTYVEITLDDLKAALVEALPGTAITIKSRTKNIAYNPNNHRWIGQLTSFDVTQMYMICVSADCEITISGLPINPAEHPVTIQNGTNWIAFPFSESMTVSNAFAGFAVNGDKVKSRNGNSQYIRNRWSGGVSALVPGQGYMYISNTQETRTFTFPVSTK